MTGAADARDPDAWTIGFEVYGTRARVAAPSPELLPRVADQLPLHAARCEPRPGDRGFALAHVAGGYAVLDGETVEAPIPTLDNALAYLRYRLFDHAVHHARDHLVVSAGVVAHEGRAIVLPGPTRAGKTMLVAALLRAGAVYYADDWAILDPQGLVRPYPTPLFRLGGKRVSAESLGAVSGETRTPVGLIARTAFVAGGSWEPQVRTAAEGVMMLVGHAYGMDDPHAAMRIARHATAGALVVEGERGEADDAAAALLALCAQAPVGGCA